MTDDDDDDFEVTMVRPPNRIKDKVTLGGKITGDGFDEELLKEAEAKAAGLHDEFLEAADIDIDKLKNACRQAETDSARRAEHLKTVERLAHDIKGYGSNINYDLLTAFADSLVVFLRMAEMTDAIKTKVARVHVDAMGLVFSRQITGKGGDLGAQLFAGLRQTTAKFLGRG